MRATALLRNSVIYCLLLLLVSCNSQDLRDFSDQAHGLISIAHLKSMLKGNSYPITSDVSIEGYVIANDLYSEYSKEIVIADQSGGITIAVDQAQTSIHFPLSARITISCSGLQLGSINGRVTLGVRSREGYRLERLSHQEMARHIFIDRQNPQTIEPQVVEISDIKSEMAGNFIAIKDVEFVDAGKSWCDKNPTSEEYINTIRYAIDTQGNQIGVFTSHECSYSGESIPSGRGEICGMVEFIDRSAVIRIIQHNIFF